MRRLVGVVAVLGLLAVPQQTAHSATRPDPVEAGVYVIGDSITNGVHRLVLTPEERPAGWNVDAVAGRRVSALAETYVRPTADEYVSKHRAFNTGGASARTAVLALGTNGFDETATVEQLVQTYTEGMNRVRWHTGARRVVLVTAWRNPEVWYPGGTDPDTGVPIQAYQTASQSWRAARAVRLLAEQNPSRVCVMPWRAYAAAHPDQFPDGVHPNSDGREAWVQILFRTIRACWS